MSSFERKNPLEEAIMRMVDEKKLINDHIRKGKPTKDLRKKGIRFVSPL